VQFSAQSAMHQLAWSITTKRT